MKKLFKNISITAMLIAVAIFANESLAQTGTLRGGSIVLTNTQATPQTITLKMPATPSTWTMTLPKDTANSTGGLAQYLYDDGTGNLNWGVPTSATSIGTVLYNATGPQLVSQATDLFNIGYQTTDPGPALGALIKVVGNGGSNTTMSGLFDTALNIKNNGTAAGTIGAMSISVDNAGTSGTVIGMNVTVSGGGTNYAGLFKTGKVGINQATPGEELEVTGNIRVSGINGLKITEGANAAMGTVVMNGVNAVVVNTTAVTANSRIFLTPQNVGVCNCVGMPYVSARVAGTSFSVQSTGAGDNSTVAWLIVEP